MRGIQFFSTYAPSVVCIFMTIDVMKFPLRIEMARFTIVKYHLIPPFNFRDIWALNFFIFPVIKIGGSFFLQCDCSFVIIRFWWVINMFEEIANNFPISITDIKTFSERWASFEDIFGDANPALNYWPYSVESFPSCFN